MSGGARVGGFLAAVVACGQAIRDLRSSGRFQTGLCFCVSPVLRAFIFGAPTTSHTARVHYYSSLDYVCKIIYTTFGLVYYL